MRGRPESASCAGTVLALPLLGSGVQVSVALANTCDNVSWLVHSCNVYQNMCVCKVTYFSIFFCWFWWFRFFRWFRWFGWFFLLMGITRLTGPDPTRPCFWWGFVFTSIWLVHIAPVHICIKHICKDISHQQDIINRWKMRGWPESTSCASLVFALSLLVYGV